MQPPVLPRDPELRALWNTRAKAAFRTVGVIVLFAAVMVGLLLMAQATYQKVNPLFPQVMVDGEWVDKPQTRRKAELVRRLREIEASSDEAEQERLTAELDTLRQAYRVHDKTITQTFFDAQWQFKVGGWILAAAFVGLVAAAGWGHHHAPEEPRITSDPPHTRLEDERRFARYLVGILIVVLVGVSLLVGIFGPGAPSSEGLELAPPKPAASWDATSQATPMKPPAATPPPKPASGQDAPTEEPTEEPAEAPAAEPAEAVPPQPTVVYKGDYEADDGSADELTIEIYGKPDDAQRKATYISRWDGDDYPYDGTFGPTAADGSIKGTVDLDGALWNVTGTIKEGVFTGTCLAEDDGGDATEATFTLKKAGE